MSLEEERKKLEEAIRKEEILSAERKKMIEKIDHLRQKLNKKTHQENRETHPENRETHPENREIHPEKRTCDDCRYRIVYVEDHMNRQYCDKHDRILGISFGQPACSDWKKDH